MTQERRLSAEIQNLEKPKNSSTLLVSLPVWQAKLDKSVSRTASDTPERTYYNRERTYDRRERTSDSREKQ